MFTAPLLDTAQLDKLISDLDRETVTVIADNFIEECRQRLLDLPDAIARKDYQEATRQAHSLKSSAANFGLMRLSELGLLMEKAFKEGRYTDGEEHAAAFKLLTADSIHALESWKNSL